jgi:hypothetical protein
VAGKDLQEDRGKMTKNFIEREEVITTFKESNDAMKGKRGIDDTPYKKKGNRLDA